MEECGNLENSKEQEEKKWESIKVKTATREKLRVAAKDMGVGIGKAVETLVEAREQAITKKIEDIGEIGDEIAGIILESGLFDIKFRGAGVETASVDGDCLFIHGYVSVEIPDESAREEILKVIKDGLERETS